MQPDVVALETLSLTPLPQFLGAFGIRFCHVAQSITVTGNGQLDWFTES